MATQRILVAGAGIVGVSTALYLQRDGFDVSLIDKVGPAAAASYGNAGVLASGAIVPVAVPGLLRKAPRMLLDRDEPLFLRWSYLPKLARFLIPFLRNGQAAKAIAGDLHTLLHDAVDQHKALAAGTPAADFITQDDWIYGYADKKAFEKDSFGWSVRRAHGVPFAEMTAQEVAAAEPALAGQFGYGVRMLNHGRITDPGAYVTALADAFVAAGGTLKQANITDVMLRDGYCDGLVADGATLTAEQYIVTLGAWSGALAQKLGITVPFDTERGYHLEYVNADVKLNGTVMHAAGKFALNPMPGRLRAAGVVEFGGTQAGPSDAPFDLLRRQVAATFPNMTYDRIDTWMGHRPSTSDSLPVIGHAPKAANVLLGYGHQHIGLTAGPKTGRWLAQLVAGRAPNTDLGAYSPDRSGRRSSKDAIS
ncbi:NAD(P)/FAD-dependent oxidoreductase [Yoonia sp. 208BN28-4]|uniref:NAD(P)/FAD-dependent oxidoreductase n=1 Tax=Yoonia sp. 208BN28-4 TaxID=3126505 RepID=UPI0030AD4096